MNLGMTFRENREEFHSVKHWIRKEIRIRNLPYVVQILRVLRINAVKQVFKLIGFPSRSGQICGAISYFFINWSKEPENQEQRKLAFDKSLFLWKLTLFSHLIYIVVEYTNKRRILLISKCTRCTSMFDWYIYDLTISVLIGSPKVVTAGSTNGFSTKKKCPNTKSISVVQFFKLFWILVAVSLRESAILNNLSSKFTIVF